MKTKISVAVISFFCACRLSFAAEKTAIPERLVILTPNSGRHFSDSPLEITWEHPVTHAGKMVYVSITLIPAKNKGTAKDGHYSLIHSAKVAVPDPVPHAAKLIWAVPTDFPYGLYRVAIVALPEDDFSAVAWDVSDDVFAITPRPKIRFVSPDVPDIRLGNSFLFSFSLEGPETYTVEAFLLKDGVVGGLVWWYTDQKGGSATELAAFVWWWTRYENESGFHFPRASTGYRVLIGVLKDPAQSSYTPGGVELKAFASYAMTEPFRLTGSLPRVFTEPTVTPRQFYIRVIGEPRTNFKLVASDMIPTLTATEFFRDTIPLDGIWESLLTKRNDENLFVFALPTGALEQ